MRVLPNLHKVTDVALSDGNDYVEVLEYSEHHAFIQIGQPNPSNTVMLRDKITLETENVPMKVTQLLELFTYCYIDFTTGIVSYISISAVRLEFRPCEIYLIMHFFIQKEQQQN